MVPRCRTAGGPRASSLAPLPGAVTVPKRGTRRLGRGACRDGFHVRRRCSQVEPADRKVITVAGDYGRGSNLTYTFFDNGTLGPGNYRFSCKVKGTAGQSVRFDVADGWRSVAGGTDLPLATAWQEHAVEFEIAAAFKNGTRMRFSLPHDTTGEFHLTDYHLRRTQ